MKQRLFLILMTMPLVFQSCRFVDDLKHMDAPRIISWSPGEENQDAATLEEVSLNFSTAMDKNLTEAACSLSENEVEIPGDFVWEENKMRFLPYKGFSADKKYVFCLQKTAEDMYGNSFSQEWCAEFTTGSDSEPPQFIEASPADLSEINNRRQEFSFIFSEPIDPQSFRDAFSILPDLKFYLQWVDSSVIFHPLEDFESGREYTMTISENLRDKSGNPIDRQLDLIYRISALEDPSLESLFLTSTGGSLNPSGINAGVEKDDIISGQLNRTFNEEERLNLVSLSPESPYSIQWDSQYRHFTLIFESLDWECYYDLTLLEDHYLLFTDGVESQPPELVSLAFCLDSTADIPHILSLNTALGAADSENAFADFLLVHSAAGGINQFSFMDALSIDSPVLNFETIGYEVYDGTQIPSPAVTPGWGESLIRIHLNIIDTGLPGVVTFSLSDILSDTLGNSLKESWALTVNQP